MISVPVLQQPSGWLAKVTTDMPGMVNIRRDPFERTPSISGENLNNLGGGYMNDFYARSSGGSSSSAEGRGACQTAIDYPPMQDPASFNLDAVKGRWAAIKNKLAVKPSERALGGALACASFPPVTESNDGKLAGPARPPEAEHVLTVQPVPAGETVRIMPCEGIFIRLTSPVWIRNNNAPK